MCVSACRCPCPASDSPSPLSPLAGFIGSYHCNLGIDSIVTAVLKAFSCMTTYSAATTSSTSTDSSSSGAFGLVPKFAIHGGTSQQDLALQNIQARIR